MASLSRDTRGNRTLQFVGPSKKRHTVRLGKITQKAAEEVKLRVERLLAAHLSNTSVDAETARWVAGLGQELADRLASVGLIEKPKAVTLGAFLDGYLAGRTDVKPRTIVLLTRARDRLVKHLGENRSPRDITRADADGWERWLRRDLAATTTGRMVKYARQFFSAAIRARLVSENPFDHLKGGSQRNEKRKYFVSREVIAKVLDACPSAYWRLIVALSRYGGLRCPSEHLELRIEDVLWDRDRFLVRSSKTEERWVPIFPELRPHLEEVFDQAVPGQEYFLAHDQGDAVNWRTNLLRIIRRAGESPWPRLFHNLRASRETELAQRYPLHVVCEWIGNSAAIAAAHYLQVTDDDFASAAKSAAQALQNPVRQAAAPTGTESNESAQTPH